MALRILVSLLLIGVAFSTPLTLYKNPEASEPSVQKVVCPDSISECPDGNTCCKHGSGYACCPQLLATCCPDEKHCCPNGYTCDVSNGKCIKKDVPHPLLELAVIKPANELDHRVDEPSDYCPGGHYCYSYETCCRNSYSTYGCCPYSSAVCCSDMDHCCPFLYTCGYGTCYTEGISHPLIELAVRPKVPKPSLRDIYCPDGGRCPGNTTCCQTASGYDCCPDPNAVCCSDSKTCCPNGDICCLTESGSGYSCCPGPYPVCCSDMKHCCPSGYTCTTGDGKCYKDGKSHPLLHLAVRSKLNVRAKVPEVK